ncbi:hypothetical protein AMTRI_Chr12g237720 [Amborella trichopoda]|uniref:Pectinesterase inhibitor domain-containing protein n=1 Tax=Amborella trichopoda TaxID=13333 RepID=W1P5E1_AMBTC|nr:uncharacterized protein LOC18430918 [Amborella trichopoda]ERN02796.1 hypothetical protein AMTR_s00086p00101390 [Amborella trichopoda]|eukprot:XP_006841121.1 uncharacterized protein LOC18430918 [Amborella trichopoda]
MAALKSNPTNANAVVGLAAIALKKSLDNASDTYNFVMSLSKAGPDPSIEPSSDVCAESYSDALFKLVDAVPALSSRALSDANTLVSAAITYADKCKQSFEGKASNSLGNRNDYLNQLCTVTLDITKLIS